MISAVCQGLLSCRRHIGKREDPGDEVASTDQVAGSLTRHVTRSRLVVVDKLLNGMKVFVHSHFWLFDVYKLKLIFLLL